MKKNLGSLKELTDRVQVNSRILKKIFYDYWDYNNQLQKYNLSVSEVVEKYELPLRKHSGELAQFLIKQGLKNVVGICQFCHKEIIKKSRKGDDKCSCGYDAFCSKCQKPFQQSYNCLYKDLCIDCGISRYNNNRITLEKKAKERRVTQEDTLILTIYQYHNEKIFLDGKINYNELSFLLKRSPAKAEEMLKQVLSKGFIEEKAYKTKDRWDHEELEFRTGEIKVKFCKVKMDESRIKQIILSKPARKIFHKLSSKYLFVFPELNPATFINFDAVKEDLDEKERRWFFMKRIDFVCCDKDFKPMIAVEYNGSYHWRKEGDYAVRKFKREICGLVGLRLIEINNYKQIESKL